MNRVSLCGGEESFKGSKTLLFCTIINEVKIGQNRNSEGNIGENMARNGYKHRGRVSLLRLRKTGDAGPLEGEGSMEGILHVGITGKDGHLER